MKKTSILLMQISNIKYSDTQYNTTMIIFVSACVVNIRAQQSRRRADATSLIQIGKYPVASSRWTITVKDDGEPKQREKA